MKIHFVMWVTLFLLSGTTPNWTLGQEALSDEPVKIKLSNGDEVIFTDSLAPSYSVDLNRGVGEFPTKDKSRSENLSIDQADNHIRMFLIDPYLQTYMNIVPEQMKEIVRIRDEACYAFGDAIEGLKYCDDPRFREVERQVELLSKRMIDQCEAVFLPYQLEARQAYGAHLAISAQGGALSSLLDGAIGSQLDNETRKRIRDRKVQVQLMVKQEMIELEKRAIEELLKGESPELQEKIKGQFSFPPDRLQLAMQNAPNDELSRANVPSFAKLFDRRPIPFDIKPEPAKQPIDPKKMP